MNTHPMKDKRIILNGKYFTEWVLDEHDPSAQIDCSFCGWPIYNGEPVITPDAEEHETYCSRYCAAKVNHR